MNEITGISKASIGCLFGIFGMMLGVVVFAVVGAVVFMGSFVWLVVELVKAREITEHEFMLQAKANTSKEKNNS